VLDALGTCTTPESNKSHFDLLPDNVATYLEWRRLVVSHAVSGAQVHDTRLVASMAVYGVAYLLTFNTDDFRRYQSISVVTPQHIVQGSA
jgi:predicted nucleic acid-binding protein